MVEDIPMMMSLSSALASAQVSVPLVVVVVVRQNLTLEIPTHLTLVVV